MTRRSRYVLAARVMPLLFVFAVPASADEGMWTYDNLPKQAVRDRYGFEVTDDWLARLRQSAVRLEGICSGSFVSGSGLVLTNHHCVSECLQAISTPGNDRIQSGFLAATPSEEPKCAEIEINQLLAIEDVTGRIQEATKGLDDRQAHEARRAAMGRIEKACTEQDRYRCDVETLYHGGRYHLYRYKPFRDVRLVFAAEAGSALFGGDPDNFNFPRYNFDVAFVRVYENDRPAVTADHLKWNAAGPQAGDLVFVAGNPGGTDRLLTVAQLEYLRDVYYPRTLLRLSEMRGRLTQFARTGAEQKRVSQDLLLYTENSLKAYRGEHETLLDKSFFARKTREEEALRAWVAGNPVRRATHGVAWDAIAKAQEVRRRIGVRYALLEGRAGFNSSLFRIARTLVRAGDERTKPADRRLREYQDAALPTLEYRLFSPAPIAAELEQLLLESYFTKLREDLGADDAAVRSILGKDSPEDLARSLVQGTGLADVARRKALWEGGRESVEASADPLIRLVRLMDPEARAVRKVYEDEVEAPEQSNAERIAQAYFENRGTAVYPDGTGTPRVTYGTVRGWKEATRTIEPFTTLAGLFDRATGKEPFALPPRWIDAQPRLRPATPLNFVTDCDVIGGNSGSPVVGRDGSVVGLVFDGNIHSLGGNFWFDDALNRSVAVHTAAITEALRTVYRADRLAGELLGETTTTTR